MLYTLAQARQAVRKFVDNGTCSTEVIDQRINEAIERLTDHADFECMRAIARIQVRDLAFPLPWNAEKLLMVAVDGTAGRIFSQPYQFLSSGPGDLDYINRCMPWPDLLDQGEFPVMFDIPKCIDTPQGRLDVSCVGMRLMAFSSHPEDTGLLIRVFGYNSAGEHIGAAPPLEEEGELLPINLWDEGVIQWGPGIRVSELLYTDVTRLLMPDVKGYVTLYAVQPFEAQEESVHDDG